MSDGAGRGVVERARAAVARRAGSRRSTSSWRRTRDGLLAPADLPVLGEVAYAAGHLDVTIEAWERAHAACLQAGDEVAAAGAAVRVAMHLLFDTALMAPVRGWLARAERLLEGQDETPAHAWFAVVRTYERMLTGDMPERSAVGAAGHRGRVRRVTRRRAPSAGSPRPGCSSWTATSSEGLALLDEAGVATVSGDLDPLSTGVVYCELVCALQGLAQYDVAEEWTEAMERWCETNAIGSLHGRCRVHRAEILRLRGSCDEAESQALVACEELRPYLRRELGWPLNELGRIRLHKGDIAGAEEALLAAHRAGWDPQPGLALVRLAQGDVGRRGRLRSETPSSTRCGCRRRSDHRTPTCSGRRCSRRRSRSRSRPATSTGPDRPPTSWSVIAARFESKALVASAAVARGTGAARRRRCGRRGAVLVRSGATLERGRRPVRGGARPPRPRRRPPRQRQRAPGRAGEPSGPHDPRRDRSRADGDARRDAAHARRTRRAADRERQRLPSRG